MNPTRLLIIAADPLTRAGLAALLAGQTQLHITGQIAPDEAPLASLQAYRPDVILWDVGWNGDSRLELLDAWLEAGVPILALAPGRAAAADLWSAGVTGILLRDADVDTLSAALVAAAHGLAVFDPDLTGALRATPSSTETFTETLTPRELEVLHGLAEGLSNKQIARQLEISEHTIKFHVNAIMGKLGAQSRTEAVVRATRAGLILL